MGFRQSLLKDVKVVIENTCTLAILQISNGYLKNLPIVDYSGKYKKIQPVEN